MKIDVFFSLSEKKLFIIYKVTFSLHPQQSFLLHILQTNLRVGRAHTHYNKKQVRSELAYLLLHIYFFAVS
jgi:hypothetical protein